MPTGTGKILGIDTEITVDAGAYGLWPQGPYQEANMAARALPGPYKIANYRARNYTVATNKAPLGPYRGVGRPGACFAIERTMDEVARAVGLDPAEVRIANMIPPRRDALRLGYRHALRHRRLPGQRPALRRIAERRAGPRRGSDRASRTGG